MVFIPGGITTIGSDRFHAEEAPQRRVRVEGFWIDRHEVTNREFADFVRATGYVTTNEKLGRSVRVPKKRRKHLLRGWREARRHFQPQ